MSEIVHYMLSQYRTTSLYGKRNDPITGVTAYHSGVDLVNGHKLPIHAFVAGEVVYADIGAVGTGYGGYGNIVVVRDKHNNYHLYAHLDSISIKVGEIILTGQKIGKQGATGRVTGSHLHYEVRKEGELLSHVDPLQYLIDYYEEEAAMELKVVQIGNVNIKIGHKQFEGIVIDGISYAPVRLLADAIGKQVEWDNKTKTVEVK